MSKQIEENPSRISFAPGNVSADRLSAVAEDRGMSRAELIREACREKIAEHAESQPDKTLHRPDREELAEAYDRLLALSDHPMGPRTVTVSEAKDQLWTQQTPKDVIVTRLLQPLAERGFISVRNARITVHRRTTEQVAAAEAAADDQLDELAEAGMDVEMRSLAPEHNELRKYRNADLQPPFRLTAWVAGEVLWPKD